MLKACSKCKKDYPLDMFYKNKNRKDGLDESCKICAKERVKAYRAANLTKVKEGKKLYYENNKEECLSKGKEYRESHLAQYKAYQGEYHEKNRGYIVEKANQWQKDNLERARENKRRSADKLRQQRIERTRERYNNDEEYKLQHKARMKKYTSTENGKLKQLEKTERRRSKKASLDCSFTPADWLKCKDYFESVCAYCGKEKSLTREHFIPLSSNGEYTVNNIIPVCKSCNSRKSNSDFFVWYPKQPFYSKQRERKILKYLNYDPITKIQQLVL